MSVLNHLYLVIGIMLVILLIGRDGHITRVEDSVFHTIILVVSQNQILFFHLLIIKEFRMENSKEQKEELIIKWDKE